MTFAAEVRGKSMVGILANVGAVVLGGLFGTVFKRYLDPAVTGKLEIVFGICAMGMGIRSIVLLENLPPVIAAVVFGTLIGLVFHVGRHIASGAALLQNPLQSLRVCTELRMKPRPHCWLRRWCSSASAAREFTAALTRA